jgi:hypothetical protein
MKAIMIVVLMALFVWEPDSAASVGKTRCETHRWNALDGPSVKPSIVSTRDFNVVASFEISPAPRFSADQSRGTFRGVLYTKIDDGPTMQYGGNDEDLTGAHKIAFSNLPRGPHRLTIGILYGSERFGSFTACFETPSFSRVTSFPTL